MAAIKLRLLKSYRHRDMSRTWPIGQVIQVDLPLAMSLIADKIAEYYIDEYPPKKKVKIELNKLK